MPMNFSKKAIAATTLVAIIIAIFGFLIIANQLYSFLSKSTDAQAENLCRDSVALRAATAVNIESLGRDSEAKVFPNLCKTIDKKISGDPAEIKRQLADKMARCYWMFGEGRYENSVFDNLPAFGGDNQCFICYTMLVEEDKGFATNEKILAPEFMNYLATTDYDRYEGTYLDYIQFGGGNGAIRATLTEEGIKPERAYAIAYKAKGSKCQWCEELLGGGGATTLGAGYLIFGVGTGGLGVVAAGVAGAGAALYSGFTLYDEAVFRETELDTIFLVDMSNELLWNKFSNECNLVTDIAGN